MLEFVPAQLGEVTITDVNIEITCAKLITKKEKVSFEFMPKTKSFYRIEGKIDGKEFDFTLPNERWPEQEQG